MKAVSPQSLDAAVAALAADPDLVPMAGCARGPDGRHARWRNNAAETSSNRRFEPSADSELSGIRFAAGDSTSVPR